MRSYKLKRKRKNQRTDSFTSANPQECTGEMSPEKAGGTIFHHLHQKKQLLSLQNPILLTSSFRAIFCIPAQYTFCSIP